MGRADFSARKNPEQLRFRAADADRRVRDLDPLSERLEVVPTVASISSPHAALGLPIRASDGRSPRDRGGRGDKLHEPGVGGRRHSAGKVGQDWTPPDRCIKPSSLTHFIMSGSSQHGFRSIGGVGTPLPWRDSSSIRARWLAGAKPPSASLLKMTVSRHEILAGATARDPLRGSRVPAGTVRPHSACGLALSWPPPRQPAGRSIRTPAGRPPRSCCRRIRAGSSCSCSSRSTAAGC